MPKRTYTFEGVQGCSGPLLIGISTLQSYCFIRSQKILIVALLLLLFKSPSCDWHPVAQESLKGQEINRLMDLLYFCLCLAPQLSDVENVPAQTICPFCYKLMCTGILDIVLSILPFYVMLEFQVYICTMQFPLTY